MCVPCSLRPRARTRARISVSLNQSGAQEERNMATSNNPRKFSEKIALHNQKQAEETAAFEEVMKDLSITRAARVSVTVFSLLTALISRAAGRISVDTTRTEPACLDVNNNKRPSSSAPLSLALIYRSPSNGCY